MGQIQTDQMELEAFCARLAPVFLEYLREHGTAVDRVEEGSSLEGITSLPARYSLGGVEKNVLVPVKLLTMGVEGKIAECQQATTRANGAADAADAAAGRVTAAITDITAEKEAALAAAARATEAATQADSKREEIELNEETRQAQETARQEAEKKRESQEETRQTQETKRGSDTAARLEELDVARENADAATLAANKAATTANGEARDLSTLKRETQEATAAAASAAQTAGEKIEVLDALMKSIGGKAAAAPVKLEVTAPATISTRNKVVQHVVARLLPVYVMQNILFQAWEGSSLKVNPAGELTVTGTGKTVLHVIPTGNTGLWQEVSITVRPPVMRLTSTGKIRRGPGARVV